MIVSGVVLCVCCAVCVYMSCRAFGFMVDAKELKEVGGNALVGCFFSFVGFHVISFLFELVDLYQAGVFA